MKLNYLSVIAATSLLAMASCSDDAPENGGGNNPEAPAAQTLGNVPVNVYTDLSKFGGTIYNYGGRAVSRAAIEIPSFEMPDYPGVPEGLKELEPKFYANAENGVLSVAGEYEFQNGGAEIYVTATDVKLKMYTGNWTINVAPGASVEFLSNVPHNAVVNVWGEADIKSIDNSTVNFAGDFKADKFTMSNDCELNVAGNLEINELTHYKGHITATTFTHNGDLSLTNDCSISVAEFMTVKGDFDYRTNGILSVKCLEVDETLDLYNCGNFNIGATLSATDLIADAGAVINLGDAAVVNVKNTIEFKNTNCAFAAGIDGEPAYVKAVSFAGNMDLDDQAKTIVKFFSGLITLDKKMVLLNSNKSYAEVNPEPVFEEDGYTFEKPTTVTFAEVTIKDGDDACAAASSKTPRPTPPTPGDEISVIRSHTHPISATCVDIAPDGGIFLSWHRRGAGMHNEEDEEQAHNAIHGCIEYLTFDGTNVNLQGFMETQMAKNIAEDPETDFDYEPVDDAYDFNHLIYDNTTNSVIAVGDHPKKGAFIAKVDAGKLTQEWENTLDIMTARQLMGGKGMSGNCVIFDDNHNLLITTAGGYQEATMDIFVKQKDNKENVGNYDWHWLANPGASVATAGSAKHIAREGNTVATIEYNSRLGKDEYDEDNFTPTLDATITIRDINNWLAGGTTISVPAFAPIYGKDVIAIDNGIIYSCQGYNGVKAYDMAGNLVNEFEIKDYMNGYNASHEDQFMINDLHEKGGANGLCISGDHLYIAYGAAGVWVLNKHTFEVESWATLEGGSANYVKVDPNNGNCYVAYGRNGIRVYKFPGLY